MLRAGFRSTTVQRQLQLPRPRYLRPPNIRQFGSSSRSSTNGFNLTRRAVARSTLLALTAAASSVFLASSLHADSDVEVPTARRSRDTAPSLGSLVRAYAVYSMCSVPALVDASPTILSTLSAIPGIKQITEAFVRVTFFDQFVGADSAEEAIPLLYSLRAANRGVLFAYSVEVDENEAMGASFSPSSADNALGSSTSPSSSSSSSSSSSPSSSNPTDSETETATADETNKHKRIVAEMLHCIDVAAGFENQLSERTANKPGTVQDTINGGRRTWVAVKMTALLPDAHALIALSSHIVESRKGSSHPEASVPFPGAARMDDLDILSKNPSTANSSSPLTPTQIRYLRELYADLYRVCVRAREKGVKVIVDAEYSWYQPAIDALTLALMREFNSLNPTKTAGEVQPLVYGTFQAYLRRTPQQLQLALQDAKKHNYAIGVKLVRGAYHPHEIAAHEAASTNPRNSLSISPDEKPPVWENKKDTDDAYNHCVGVLIRAVKDDLTGMKSIDNTNTNTNSASISVSGSGSGARIVSKRDWVKGYLGLGSKNENDVQTSIESKPPISIVPSTTTTTTTTTTATPRIGILFGTHNWESCALILKELLQNGLAVVDEAKPIPIRDGDSDVDGPRAIRVGREIVERVAIGQLYGMSDDLTEWVVSRISSTTPFVIKYVPYGALADVMPYLSRRAIENKSVLGDGNAQHERKRARLEIQRRIFGH